MLRSGFILGVSAPAAVIALLTQPVIRDGADLVSARSQALVVADRSAISEKLPLSVGVASRLASVLPSEKRTDRGTVSTLQTKPDKASSKAPRRLIREGCEAAISSLAGPEARRMVPGRCIA